MVDYGMYQGSTQSSLDMRTIFQSHICIRIVLIIIPIYPGFTSGCFVRTPVNVSHKGSPVMEAEAPTLVQTLTQISMLV